jgi:hypothetical protein
MMTPRTAKLAIILPFGMLTNLAYSGYEYGELSGIEMPNDSGPSDSEKCCEDSDPSDADAYGETGRLGLRRGSLSNIHERPETDEDSDKCGVG